MKTTVIIPNYNGMEYLDACLQSVYRNTGTQHAVIIVDNGSKDGSLEMAEEKYPWVKVIAFPENRGFSEAVNAGIRAAKTPYVFLLNNDTTIAVDCIHQLERQLDKHPKAFSAGARMLMMAHPQLLDGEGDLYSALGWAYAVGKGKKAAGRGHGSRKVFSTCAGAALYRREWLEQIGLFDENHFAYLEDVDVGYRAQLHGWTNITAPEAVVYHAGSATSGARYNPFKVRLSARNNVYLIFKNMPLWQRILNSPFLLAGFLIKYLFFAKKGFGKIYVQGLGEGIKLCRSQEGRAKKVDGKGIPVKNYVRVQLQLWINMFRRF